MLKIKKISIITLIVICIFSAGIFVGNHYRPVPPSGAQLQIFLPAGISSPHILPATGSVEVVFSPGGGATDEIIKAIGSAKKSIQVQAYEFTSKPIAMALINAQKGGVDVRVILDKSNLQERNSMGPELTAAGIPVRLDHGFHIAHNKIMIIDTATVITGSFNFTASAEKYNGENLEIFRGNQPLADLFEQNWNWRWNASE